MKEGNMLNKIIQEIKESNEELPVWENYEGWTKEMILEEITSLHLAVSSLLKESSKCAH